MKMPYPCSRVIRESVGGLAIRSRANLDSVARSDAKPVCTFADRATGAEWQAEGNIDEY
jgi:hypothetical protein